MQNGRTEYQNIQEGMYKMESKKGDQVMTQTTTTPLRRFHETAVSADMQA